MQASVISVTTIEVRAAGAGDIAEIARIFDRPASPAGLSLDHWPDQDRVHVAEVQGAIVGFVVSSQSFFGNEFIELVHVLPEARRLGVASCLLATVSESRRSQKLFTSTNLSNRPMQQVLIGLDWASAGIVYGLDDGDPELFYQAPPLRSTSRAQSALDD